MKRGLHALLVAASLTGCGPANPQTPPPAPAAGVRIIVTLADWEPMSFERSQPRRAGIASRLVERAARTQPPVRAWLFAHGASEVVSLPIVNGLAATLPPHLVPELHHLSGVQSVTLDRVISAPETAAGAGAAPQWNLDAIRAPDLWRLGYTGKGVVVANMDTGVDLAHPDLRGGYRGGTNSWFDPFQHSAEPNDPIGHGTQTMAILAGGAAGGTGVGVAPDATWIAARIFDAEGRSSISVIHQAFLWLLDPDGDPSTPDAPAVVSASWAIGSPNACDLSFQRDLEVLAQAGIAVVFAAGNSGPAESSSVSPANNPFAFSAGSVDAAATVAPSSSRGPSACTGAAFPDLVAPGIDVRTADRSFGGFPQYANVSGTSFAAPHVAGALALLVQALPGTTPEALADALRGSAVDLGDSGAGRGLLDVYGAYTLLSTPAPGLRGPLQRSTP
jgi:subtilisin family serine protease